MRCQWCPETARYARRLRLDWNLTLLPYGVTNLWLACEAHVVELERIMQLDTTGATRPQEPRGAVQVLPRGWHPGYPAHSRRDLADY